MCKFLDGPQDIDDCIGDEKEVCGLSNCIIRSPYLHIEDCKQLYDGDKRVFEKPNPVTCPPCPTCPTAMV